MSERAVMEVVVEVRRTRRDLVKCMIFVGGGFVYKYGLFAIEVMQLSQ